MVDRFEQYDAGVNVEAFSHIHNDFFDHAVRLPNVQIQQPDAGRTIPLQTAFSCH